MVSLEQIRKISTEDLLSLGVKDVAYLKDVEVDGSTAVGIFAANGQQLAQDDDSGGNLQARITFRCEQSGGAEIAVTGTAKS